MTGTMKMGQVLVAALAALAAMPTMASTATPAGIRTLLVGPGEMPGFVPLAPRFFRTPSSLAKDCCLTRKQTNQLVTGLKRAGFRGALAEHLRPVPAADADAVSSVEVFGSPAKATAQLSRGVRLGIALVRLLAGDQATIQRIAVPTIAGAKAWTQGIRGQPGGAVNVFWTAGRCLFFVGDTTSATDYAAPAIAAASVLNRRLTGRSSQPVPAAVTSTCGG